MTLPEALEYIERCRAAGRLGQAYLVVGASRTEGTEFAEQVMMQLVCPAKGCGRCGPCTQIRKHTHPDMHWVEPEKKSRIIGVEQMRSLIQVMNQTAFAGGWKAAVLVAADRLNESSANAFLKTLEEPAPRTIFFLLTETPQFLLPTVVSRCHRLAITMDREEVPREWRERIAGALGHTGLGGAPGGVGHWTAVARVETFLGEFRKTIEAEEKARAGEEDAEMDDDTLAARVSARFREVQAAIMKGVLLWYRDQLLLVGGGDEALLFYPEYVDVLRARAAALTFADAVANLRHVEAIHRRLERNMNATTVFSAGLAQVR